MAGGRGGVVALGAIRAMVRALVGAEVAAFAPSLQGSERKASVEFLTGAYVALLVRWLDDGARLQAAQMDARFRSLALAGLAPPKA